MSPTPSTPKRHTKSPATRAQEALDVAQRAVDRLSAKLNAVELEGDTLSRELADARRRRDYLAQHPDLPITPTTTAKD